MCAGEDIVILKAAKIESGWHRNINVAKAGLAGERRRQYLGNVAKMGTATMASANQLGRWQPGYQRQRNISIEQRRSGISI